MAGLGWYPCGRLKPVFSLRVSKVDIITQPSSSVVSHVLISGNMSVLNSKMVINNCTP